MDQILYPLEWVVANIMWAWHAALTFVGLESTSGITWGLSIVGLTVTIRVLLIPLFVKQIKASRAMQVIAPELKAVQNKYKGKKDQASREAMSRETMELYAKHKTNPFASCLPLIIQAPIFFALFRVLNWQLRPEDPTLPESEWVFEGIGRITPELAADAYSATLFGARLSDTFLGSDVLAVKIVSAILIVLMVATTFLTQRQLTRKNMPAAALEGPMAQQQKILMYVLPFIFVVTGPNFPVGVLIYWTTSNLWTMGQQFYVIRRNPTPGSEAERVYNERRAQKARHRAERTGQPVPEEFVEPEKPRGQRQQPKRKDRAKGTKPPRDEANDSGDEPNDANDKGAQDD
jgi:YidC/Oxa1 family membrane protein insertase